MKKILFTIALFVAIQAQAQQSLLLKKDFWENKPDITQVQQELSKGFDWAKLEGTLDPIFLAMNNGASNEVIKFLIDQPGVDLKRHLMEGRIYLHIAGMKRNPEIVDYLIKKGSDIYYYDSNGQTPFTFAGYSGNLSIPMIESFVNGGLDLQKKYEKKNDANILLLSTGYDTSLVLTNYFVSKGLDIHSVDNQGNTAFNYACQVGNIDILKALIAKGVKYNNGALLMAAQGTHRTSNNLELFKYLVEELKLDPKVTNAQGQNILHILNRKMAKTDVVEYFMKKCIDVNSKDVNDNTPFILAAATKNEDVIKMMLPKVKNINTVNKEGISALMNAVKGSSTAGVQLLLEKGAKTNLVDKNQNTLVTYLVDSYKPLRPGTKIDEKNPDPAIIFKEKVSQLIKAGADLKKIQSKGNSILHLLAVKDEVKLYQAVSGLGIDINLKNSDGLTALHKSAMITKDIAVLKHLVELGANKSLKSDFEETAYDLAKPNETLVKKRVSLDFLK